MPDGTCRIIAVTGTDTGVGKTVVAAGLALRARELGISVAAIKPIESGVKSRWVTRKSTLPLTRPSQWSDAERLAAACGLDGVLSLVGPVTLEEPLAPMVAAERAGLTIDMSAINAARESLSLGRQLLIAEGAGGLLTPISRTLSFAGLFKQWGTELILVVGNRLGALNHTLLTLCAANSMGLQVTAIVLTSLSDGGDSVAETTNFDALVALLPHHRIYKFAWVQNVDEPTQLSAAVQNAGLDDLLTTPV